MCVENDLKVIMVFEEESKKQSFSLKIISKRHWNFKRRVKLKHKKEMHQMGCLSDSFIFTLPLSPPHSLSLSRMILMITCICGP